MKQTSNKYLTDRMLAKRIQDRISWDKRISNSDIQVVSRLGNVILKGLVDSVFRKDAAQEIALNTEGVMSVDNMIIASPFFQRSDDEIKHLTEEKLHLLKLTETEFINVTVSEGKVTLEGLVHSSRKKAQTSGFVWELSGVMDCINKIEITDKTQTAKWANSAEKVQDFLGGEDFLKLRLSQVVGH